MRGSPGGSPILSKTFGRRGKCLSSGRFARGSRRPAIPSGSPPNDLPLAAPHYLF